MSRKDARATLLRLASPAPRQTRGPPPILPAQPSKPTRPEQGTCPVCFLLTWTNGRTDEKNHKKKRTRQVCRASVPTVSRRGLQSPAIRRLTTKEGNRASWGSACASTIAPPERLLPFIPVVLRPTRHAAVMRRTKRLKKEAWGSQKAQESGRTTNAVAAALAPATAVHTQHNKKGAGRGGAERGARVTTIQYSS